jgi:signal transduction histidine kinase
MFLLIVSRTQGLTREVTVQDERRRLLGRVLQAAEDERTRIAHDLHDGPVQQLAVLNYDVYRARKRLGDLLGRTAAEELMEELQRTDEVLEAVEKGLGEETKVLRRLMSALRPPCSTTEASPMLCASTHSGSRRRKASPSTSTSAYRAASRRSWRRSCTASSRSR